ncbi:MAG TPA: prohibitin family protein [Rhodocyclaceae bacterium]|nr:prohibitin family protein [Rhodocyclaceae bacterium]
MSKFSSWTKDRAPWLVVGLLVVLLIVVALWGRIFILIKPGEAGVIYRPLTTGTVTDYIYPEGLHILQPLNSMFKYDTRVQIIFHDINVLTSSGLPIKLSIAVRFQPIYELIGVLHQTVGPDYPNKIILPQIESVMRRNIGNYTPEDIYTNREGVLSKIITLALEEVGRKFIQVDDIIIRSVELPETVRTSIENKLISEQMFLSYNFKLKTEEQEAKRKQIEAEGIKAYQDIITPTLTDKLLKWQGVQATLDLAKSNNAKVVVVGGGKDGLPIILGDR